MSDNSELEKNIDSLVAMVSDLYEKVHRGERVLMSEETIEPIAPEVDEYGPEGLLAKATSFVQESGKCSVSRLQKHFKISYKRAFSLLDVLETEGVIAPYRGEPERSVNQ
jgi:DNA segregation ATPase FtsK/SpoIIIE-like protein